MSALLPSFDQGYLPLWLLFVGVTSTINGITNLFKSTASHKVYSTDLGRAQATPLAGRLFGVWNITSSVVRLLAAYRVNERSAYELAMATFVIAIVHFTSENILHRTSDIKQTGTLAPFFVAGGSLFWMWSQYSHYLA